MTNYYEGLVKGYFKDMYGNPFPMSSWQQETFRVIYEPSILRAAVKAITQYGKSEIASMALLAVAIERREKILIIAPSVKQAGIIMGKVIDHIFDHMFITGMIDYATTGSLERLKQERSKTRITFKNGSEIMILTAEASHVAKEARS